MALSGGYFPNGVYGDLDPDRPHLRVVQRVVSNEDQAWMVFDVVDADGNIRRTIGDEHNPPSEREPEPELKTDEDKYLYRLGAK